MVLSEVKETPKFKPFTYMHYDDGPITISAAEQKRVYLIHEYMEQELKANKGE